MSDVLGRVGLLTVPFSDSACRRFHVPRWLDFSVPLAAAKLSGLCEGKVSLNLSNC